MLYEYAGCNCASTENIHKEKDNLLFPNYVQSVSQHFFEFWVCLYAFINFKKCFSLICSWQIRAQREKRLKVLLLRHSKETYAFLARECASASLVWSAWYQGAGADGLRTVGDSTNQVRYHALGRTKSPLVRKRANVEGIDRLLHRLSLTTKLGEGRCINNIG